MAQEKTNVTNETEELSAEKVNEIFQVRRDKLAALKENGKNPFEEVKYDVTATSAQIVAEYKDEN
jgi:lysyl-tRNA synthetase class 2